MSETEKDDQFTPDRAEVRKAWINYRLDYDRFGRENFGRGNLIGEEFDRYLLAEIQHPGSCVGCGHASDCSLHNQPAMANTPCNCGKNVSDQQIYRVDPFEAVRCSRCGRYMTQVGQEGEHYDGDPIWHCSNRHTPVVSTSKDGEENE